MQHDEDPVETREWLDALESIIENEGVDRAKYVLERLAERASRDGTLLPYAINTPFPQHHSATQGSPHAGRPVHGAADTFPDPLERPGDGHAGRIKRDDLGGHVSSFSSIATLYDVGFNYFLPCRRRASAKRTWSICRGTRHPGSMPAPSWKAV